jgi:hypothetical protein
MPQQRSTYTWNGEAVERKLRAATALGLTKWSEYVLQESRNVVPLDEGTLERSGTASVDPRTLTAAVSYDTPYAVEQHENLEIVHPGGREAKYLERPWLESRGLAAPMIAKEIRKATR